MRNARTTRSIRHALKPLVVCLLAALPAAGVCAPHARSSTGHGAQPAATTWAVENCDDDGPGSLRDIVEEHAHSGDIVDLSQLTCSTISLTTGAIDIGRDDLTLRGPGATRLMIDGDTGAYQYNYDRLIDHSGDGTLEIDDLTLRNPAAKIEGSEPTGGCIRSLGNVYLLRSTLTECRMWSPEPGDIDGGALYVDGDVTLMQSTVSASLADATHSGFYSSHGGGIFANGNATLRYSAITGNEADANAYRSEAAGGGLFVNGNLTLESSIIQGNKTYIDVDGSHINAEGGGILVHGALTMTDSLVDGNHCDTNASAYSHYFYSRGGGIWSDGPLTITRSAITGNTAYDYAGLLSLGSGAAHDRIITDSTIAANQSTRAPAGIYAVALLVLDNSTVAFNTATLPAADGDAGIRALLGIEMQSSIVSNNTAAAVAADIRAPVTGANNLIYAPGVSTLPADTRVGQDPLLAGLADNGGLTPTLELSPGSPAIDAGNNADADTWDQRGPGFARAYGAAADIGAFELQPQPGSFGATPALLDFGDIDAGQVSAAMIANVYNNGSDPVTVQRIDAVAAPFAPAGGTCGAPPIVILPGNACTLAFTFAPSSFGSFEQPLVIDGDGGSTTIDLRGEGILAVLSVTPDVIDFGSVAVGSTSPAHSITLRNAGNGTLDITGLDAATEPFAQTGGTCGAPPIQLGADESCTVDFLFSPVAPGTALQTLNAHSTTGDDDFTLLGNGTEGGDDDRVFANGFES